MSGKIWNQVQQEITQNYELRKPLLSKISNHFNGRYVVSFYTRFRSTARIDNHDADMLATLLRSSGRPLTNKILFLINSPGGDPLAAEKIIKVLSEYSANDYWALVPSTAKSAATMICLGASKIILSPISELGPIDLQVPHGDVLIPAHSIITAYDKLIDQGINLASNQRIEPILQQLQAFDPSEIEFYRQVNELSSDIAVKVLKNCMLKKLEEKAIRKTINIFLDPKKSKTHGRPIYYSHIKEVDPKGNFNVELIKTTDNVIWKVINEYHTRVITHLRVTGTSKLLESDEMSVRAGGGEQ